MQQVPHAPSQQAQSYVQPSSASNPAAPSPQRSRTCSYPPPLTQRPASSAVVLVAILRLLPSSQPAAAPCSRPTLPPSYKSGTVQQSNQQRHIQWSHSLLTRSGTINIQPSHSLPTTSSATIQPSNSLPTTSSRRPTLFQPLLCLFLVPIYSFLTEVFVEIY